MHQVGGNLWEETTSSDPQDLVPSAHVVANLQLQNRHADFGPIIAWQLLPRYIWRWCFALVKEKSSHWMQTWGRHKPVVWSLTWRESPFPPRSRKKNSKKGPLSFPPTQTCASYDPDSSQDKEDDTLTRELKKNIRSNRCTHQMLQRACWLVFLEGCRYTKNIHIHRMPLSSLPLECTMDSTTLEVPV